jgi:hypothetical protein
MIGAFLWACCGDDGICDVDELGHDTLSALVCCFVDSRGIPQRQNSAIKLSEELVPFLIWGRFTIYTVSVTQSWTFGIADKGEWGQADITEHTW